MEPLSATLLTFALVLLVASWMQLIFAASDNDFAWALCAVFIPPFAYLYGLWRWDAAGSSIKTALIGLAVLWLSL